MNKTIFTGMILLALTTYANEVETQNTLDLPSSATNVQLLDAEYVLVPTKTEVREIPNCDPYSESAPTCEETVVVESSPAIQVNLSYYDSFSSNDGLDSTAQFIFKLSDARNEDVALLKSVYPGWKHPFTSVGRKFVKNHVAMTVAKAQRTIQVIDMSKSHICFTDDNGNPEPGCVEQLVYKDALTTVLNVKVNLK